MKRRVLMYALALLACAVSISQPIPSRSADALSAKELYVRAIAVMENLKQPAYVTYRLESTSDGLKGEISQTCIPCLSPGSNADHWMYWHRTWDYASAILDETNGTRVIARNAANDPTWYGTARALHTGMIHRVLTYKVPNPSAPPVAPQATATPDTTLKTISLLSIIGPGIYQIEDRGDAACPNGAPGRALHLWSRRRNPGHQLSDVIVDGSMRFCMMRFGVRAPGPLGGNVFEEVHFADVGGYWMQTDGFVDATLRLFGVRASHGRWYFRLTDMQFPKSLPNDTFKTTSSGFDANAYLHAQRLVDIGGRRLNLYCTGTGSPTVVLDAGGGDTMLDWRFMQPLLAKHVRVCSFDRAGFGFSDPAPLPRDAGANAADLHSLVTRAGIATPFVLVGYSSSTLSARIYADRYPADLAGLVLVGPDIEDHENALAAAAPALAPIFARADAMQKACDAAATCASPPDPLLPPAIDAILAQQWKRPLARADAQSENESDSTASTREVRAEQQNYGALPLLVITAEDVFPPGSYLPAQQRAAERAFISRIRAPLMTYSSRAALLRVAGCNHEDITTDCAGDIASGIERLLK